MTSFPEECSTILNRFADASSNFTKCSILHARPIRICSRCIDQYMQFKTIYDELLNTVVNGTSCKSIFISHDRLDAVLEYHDNILSIWDKGHCNSKYLIRNLINSIFNEQNITLNFIIFQPVLTGQIKCQCYQMKQNSLMKSLMRLWHVL